MGFGGIYAYNQAQEQQKAKQNIKIGAVTEDLEKEEPEKIPEQTFTDLADLESDFSTEELAEIEIDPDAQELAENENEVIEEVPVSKVTEEVLQEYANPDSTKYEQMVEEIRKEMNFTSLAFARLDDMLESVGIDKCKLCTYCWDGKEK